jgi:hypothetical protein
MRLPDDRGLFDRYLDLSRGLDLNRLHDYAGGLEQDQIKSHQHFGFGEGFSTWPLGVQGPNNKLGSAASDSDNYLYGTTNTGGDQTHPKNVGKIPLIKY